MADNNIQQVPSTAQPPTVVPKVATAPKAAPKKAGATKAAPKKSNGPKITAAAKKSGVNNGSIAQQNQKIDLSTLSCCGAWRKLNGCGKFNIIWYLFWLSPFIIEGSVWLIAMAALIPIGFLFGSIKHFVPVLWAIIILLVNLGGLADLGADILMLIKVVIYHYTHEIDHEIFENKLAENLFFARLIVTLVTGVPGVIMIFFISSDAYQQLTGKKGKVVRSTNGIMAVLLMVIWKLAMIWARLKLLWLIFKSLIKHKKVTEETEKEAQTWEFIAVLDVLWAAIPLGILTALEAFYFEDIAHVTPSKIFELIKLGALAIDLIGVSFFFYFELAGLNKVFNKCHKHHHETAAINQGVDEKSPLIISSERDIAPSDANV